MKLKHMRYFLALADELNFTRAGNRLGISPSDLANAIAQLGDDIGGELLSRDDKEIRLTVLGQRMRAEFDAIVANADKAVLFAHSLTQKERPRFSVGISNTLGPHPLSRLWKAFTEEEPSTQLLLYETMTTDLPALVLSGSLDCGVCSDCTTVNPKLNVITLCNERLLLACAKSHPFAELDVVPVERLSTEPYLDRLNCEFRECVTQSLTERGVLMTPRIQTDKEEWIQRLIAFGLGVAFLPEFAARSDDIVIKPVQGIDLTRKVQFISVKTSAPSKSVITLERLATNVDWLRARHFLTTQ